MSLGTRDVGITEIVLHKEALNGVHRPVPRVDKCHGSPKDPQSCLEFGNVLHLREVSIRSLGLGDARVHGEHSDGQKRTGGVVNFDPPLCGH